MLLLFVFNFDLSIAQLNNTSYNRCMFANPKDILEQVGISAGATVVDLGCGSGHYAMLAAKMVTQGETEGTEGKVYAIDVQKELLDRLQNEAKREHINNIHVVWGNFEKLNGTKLSDSTADVVIISNVLFQIEDRVSFVKEVSRITKSGGRILVIDWAHARVGVSKALLLTRTQAEELFTGSGFEVTKEINAGAEHYGFILRKK